MDVRTLLSTFAAVFLAEVGDKTQLATFALSASSRSKAAVFLGAVAALASTSAIAVLLGEAVTRAIPALWIRRGAGLLFVGLGLFYLVRAPAP
jgi:putative Ca2+/H+ antiporter (TMEM165/GDT1 family)